MRNGFLLLLFAFTFCFYFLLLLFAFTFCFLIKLIFSRPLVALDRRLTRSRWYRHLTAPS
uniref:Uncharacterized protein n=1 Tax=Shewanella decolorationis TaxID=256839 RepID=A0A5B8QV77_9GAMM